MDRLVIENLMTTFWKSQKWARVEAKIAGIWCLLIVNNCDESLIDDLETLMAVAGARAWIK